MSEREATHAGAFEGDWLLNTNKVIRRATNAGGVVRGLAIVFAALIVLTAVVVVVAASDATAAERVGWVLGFLLGGLTLPALMWAFGSLIELHATRLDLAVLDSDIFDDES
jgi:hypothetical protein